jgi:hypothetical protein
VPDVADWCARNYAPHAVLAESSVPANTVNKASTGRESWRVGDVRVSALQEASERGDDSDRESIVHVWLGCELGSPTELWTGHSLAT